MSRSSAPREKIGRKVDGAEADSPSLSKSHNSDGGSSGAEQTQPDLPFRLTGSQAKTAYALRLNCEAMMQEAGIERIGFLTLTVGDATEHGFAQVFDSSEASRRINNLSRRVLPDLFERWIVVTERHKNGAIHFHLVGVMREKVDIRTGFDWKSFKTANVARSRGAVDAGAERAYAVAASPALRDAWRMLRETLPGYGFGRAELTPVEKTAGAISSYVSKYVEKNLFNRLKEDKGKRLVRYGGWKTMHLKPNQFSWANERAAAWRTKTRQLAGLVGISERDEMPLQFGPRWAFRMTRVMHAVDDYPAPSGFDWSWPEREAARRMVWQQALRPKRFAEPVFGVDHWREAA